MGQKFMRTPSMLFALSLVTIPGLGGCTMVQLVAPYDESIYNGLTEYKSDLNLHVKNMADLAGTPAGTYQANQLRYNELETRIELMIDRAHSQSTGISCRLSPDLFGKVEEQLRERAPPELVAARPEGEAEPNTYGCTEMLLKNVKLQLDFLQEIHRNADRCKLKSPGSVQVVEVDVANLQPAPAGELDQVVDQAVSEVVESLRTSLTLALLAKLDGMVVSVPEADADAGVELELMVSCLRPDSARDALSISNQAIDAAWFVENAKKQGVE